MARIAAALATILLVGACTKNEIRAVGGDVPPGTVDDAAPPAPDTGPPALDALPGGGIVVAPRPCDPCNDFPPDPIVDIPVDGRPAPPADSATKFGPAGSGSPAGGPCLYDPEDGTLFPRNWPRPRLRWTAPPGQDLFELRFQSPKQKNDLVVYTTDKLWTMPKEIWRGLVANNADTPITVTIRGLAAAGGMPSLGGKATFTVSRAAAPGTIVYWTTGDAATKMTALKAFSIGDEGVITLLGPPDVDKATPPAPGPGRCIGCHGSSPDGQFIGFSASNSGGSGDTSWVEVRSGTQVASRPSFISPDGLALLNRVSTEMPSFSPAHWKTGDHTVVAMYNPLSAGNVGHIVWIDLEATSQKQGEGWDYLVARGDNGLQGNPAWSRGGDRVAYHSAAGVSVAGLVAKGADIFVVPYGRVPGTPAKLPGASDPAWSEFYPAWSPSDTLIAFSRAPNDESSYNNPNAEVFVLPSQGGKPQRLRANDPPKCLGRKSPGVTNSWPKWAPAASPVGGQGSVYFLVFSSTREGGKPQLFVVPIVKRDGEFDVFTDYPALYLWNQPENEGNHTPAWDVLKIPIL